MRLAKPNKMTIEHVKCEGQQMLPEADLWSCADFRYTDY